MPEKSGWVELPVWSNGRTRGKFDATMYIRASQSPYMRIARRWIEDLHNPERVLVQINRTKQMIRLVASDSGRGRRILPFSDRKQTTTFSCGGFPEALGMSSDIQRIVRFDAEITPRGELLLTVRTPEDTQE